MSVTEIGNEVWFLLSDQPARDEMVQRFQALLSFVTRGLRSFFVHGSLLLLLLILWFSFTLYFTSVIAGE